MRSITEGDAYSPGARACCFAQQDGSGDQRSGRRSAASSFSCRAKPGGTLTPHVPLRRPATATPSPNPPVTATPPAPLPSVPSSSLTPSPAGASDQKRRKGQLLRAAPAAPPATGQSGHTSLPRQPTQVEAGHLATGTCAAASPPGRPPGPVQPLGEGRAELAQSMARPADCPVPAASGHAGSSLDHPQVACISAVPTEEMGKLRLSKDEPPEARAGLQQAWRGCGGHTALAAQPTASWPPGQVRGLGPRVTREEQRPREVEQGPNARSGSA
ncbi:uncharacterized protein [Dasypus novemcinctus]|uniref:uncharacterized protein n=1 Tax=Dasypus novemcinctus TaxID=9361 RepID=UPI0039C9332F